MTDKNGELPKGWKWVKLGDICELQNGYAFKSNTFTKQGVPVIKMGNISKDFRLRWEPNTLSYLPEEFLKIYESFVVAKNDLLITLTDMSPSGEYLGTVALYTQDIPALLNELPNRSKLRGITSLRLSHFVVQLHSTAPVRKLFLQIAASCGVCIPQN